MTDFMTRLDTFIFHPLTLSFVGFAGLCVLMLVGLNQIKPGKTNPLKFSETGWLNALGWFSVLFSPVLILLFLSVLFMLGQVGWKILTGDTIREGSDNLRWYVLSFVGLLTALGGIIGTPLALLRVWTTERQTKTAEQSYIAEILAKAGENLAADKALKEINSSGKSVETSPPSLQRRILGILALERLARENSEYHIQIMEMLVAYIRENAHAREAKRSPHEIFETLTANSEHGRGLSAEEAYQNQYYRDANPYGWNPTELHHISLQKWVREQLVAREDIQTALSVIGRREAHQIKQEKQRGHEIDLRSTNLQGAKLKGNFDSILFGDARMDGVIFDGSFKECKFGIYTERAQSGASLQGARVLSFDATGSDFSGANLDSAFFGGATLNQCLFRMAKMNHTNFNGASLCKADFAFSRPKHVYCYQDARFEKARFYSTDLREFKGIAEGSTSEIWFSRDVEATVEQEARFTRMDRTIGELDDRREWLTWRPLSE